MSRIPILSVEEMTVEQRRVYDTVVSGPRGELKGPLMAALHRPELADKWQQFGAMLRYGTSFPPRLSELAILVTAHHYQCALEWHFHEKPARDAGLSDDIIEDLRLGRTPTIDDDDALDVYRFSRELHSLSRVGEASYAAVLDRWGVVGVVELTALIGYYTMVAMTLNTHAYSLPKGVRHPFQPLPAIERS